MTADNHDEPATLDARVLQLERAIAARRQRIASLVGTLDARQRSLAERIRPEVVVALPPLDVERARVEVMRALHEELGLLGAVTIEGGTMQWRPLHRVLGARIGLEVDLETGAQGATLRMRDTPFAGVSPTAYVAATMFATIPVTAVAVMLVRDARALPTSAVLALTMLTIAASLVPLLSWSKRRTRAALQRFAERVAAQLPRKTALRVRVSEDADLENDHVIEKEVARGLP
ncbi:hypothetical protein [Sandaracinus amylolyticus]|uniref:Uncharacterized protein n=1 Tax=Sandaracinus amylolyticus TaxID=927083 RepID=A0A0F6YNA4_9BACT|nr:hypothetical protein [Sandaracinus amylolyticus]AKF11151.1 hypothetical protein DB32_008300 [Sandaracinus amylolyticus]